MAARMNVGDPPREVRVDSPEKWNDSGIIVARGEEYEIDVPPDQIWIDRTIENTPDGSSSRGVVQKLTVGLRRKPDAPWFALIAAIGQSDEADSMTVIGAGKKPFHPQMDGQLYFFANDVRVAYGNNKGAITLTITRTR